MRSRTVSSAAGWTSRDVRREFRRLAAPEPLELAGRWDGALVGGPALLLTGRLLVALTPLRGWCGKQVTDTGRVLNLVRRRGVQRPSETGRLTAGASLIDGDPAAVVSYRQTAEAPVRWLRGEIRWLRPGAEALGVIVLPVGRHVVGPFPFLLTRTDLAEVRRPSVDEPSR